jgi:hypothetical protein
MIKYITITDLHHFLHRCYNPSFKTYDRFRYLKNWSDECFFKQFLDFTVYYIDLCMQPIHRIKLPWYIYQGMSRLGHTLSSLTLSNLLFSPSLSGLHFTASGPHRRSSLNLPQIWYSLSRTLSSPPGPPSHHLWSTISPTTRSTTNVHLLNGRLWHQRSYLSLSLTPHGLTLSLSLSLTVHI